MKLLIITQKIDKDDPVLGFFHRWVEVFSKNYETIIVICLYRGKCDLPENVKVLSLGKEDGKSRIKYIFNLYKYIWKEKNNYDKVFVHMNQEYILLVGLIWKYLNKDIFMWRNHHAGSILTDISSWFCKKVFCTSKFSYTAKYKNTEIMPVGVDLQNFKPINEIKRLPKSILSLGRISPSKHIDLLIDVIVDINSPDIITSVYGDPLPQDKIYYEGLKRKGENHIDFYKGITNTQTIAVYSAHEIFVNLSSSGMYDKTIFEAIACGCLILASNDNLRGQINDDFIFKQGDKKELSYKINKLINYNNDEKDRAISDLRKFIDNHSLDKLSIRLANSIN